MVHYVFDNSIKYFSVSINIVITMSYTTCIFLHQLRQLFICHLYNIYLYTNNVNKAKKNAGNLHIIASQNREFVND